MIKYYPILIVLSLSQIYVSCDEKESPDNYTIIYSDQIYTGTDDSAEAIAISDGKIVAMGSKEDMNSYVSPTAEIIDATGSFVMPGFIEGHGHFSRLGSSLMNLNFLRSKSWDDIVAMVKEKAENAKPGEWIIGRGWHQEKWSVPVHDHVHGYPKHFKLSDISPDNPVLLVHASGHGIFANQKAMEMAGVNKETANPVGGEIVRDENGMAIGVFEERAAQIVYSLYEEYLKQLSEEELKTNWLKGIELAQDECFKKGITSFQDAGSQFHELERYTQMAEDGDMRIRLWAMMRHSSEKMSGDISKYRVIGAGDDRFTCRAIKSELDGALGSFGAWLLEPYDDKPHFHGQNTTTLDEVKAIAEIAYRNDMQLCVHGIGDRANRETLDIMEEFFTKNQAKDLRWRIEHSQHLHPDDIPRFAELGVIPAMQGIHCTSDAPYVVKRLGEQRAKEGAYNWRALLDAGAIVTNGTDAPVEDVDPIESYYASVTRKRIDNGMEFFPENSMTREEALKSYTISNAYAAFEEDIKGTLEVGKLGDITILSKNLLSCTDDEILEAEVLYTIVGGDIMYQQP